MSDGLKVIFGVLASAASLIGGLILLSGESKSTAATQTSLVVDTFRQRVGFETLWLQRRMDSGFTAQNGKIESVAKDVNELKSGQEEILKILKQ